MKYRFHFYGLGLMEKVEGTTTTYRVPHVDVEAPDPTEGWALARVHMPPGFRLLSWSDLEIDKEE